jgi:hypothetical protein
MDGMAIDERALDRIIERASRLKLEFILVGNAAGWLHEAPLSEMRRVVAEDLSVDFVFRLGERQKFESIRSRAARMRKGKREVLVAALEDVVRAKESARRQKDKLALPILRATLQAKQAIEKENNEAAG